MSNTVMIREDGNWYNKKKICDICGVNEKTFRNFIDEISLEIDFQSEIRTLAHNKKLYSETILKQFQMWLKKNAMNAGGQRTERTIGNSNQCQSPASIRE